MSDTAYALGKSGLRTVVAYLGGLDVGGLCLSSLLTLGVLVENVNWRS
jgi:hypothetical protein